MRRNGVHSPQMELLKILTEKAAQSAAAVQGIWLPQRNLDLVLSLLKQPSKGGCCPVDMVDLKYHRFKGCRRFLH